MPIVELQCIFGTSLIVTLDSPPTTHSPFYAAYNTLPVSMGRSLALSYMVVMLSFGITNTRVPAYFEFVILLRRKLFRVLAYCCTKSDNFVVASRHVYVLFYTVCGLVNIIVCARRISR